MFDDAVLVDTNVALAFVRRVVAGEHSGTGFFAWAHWTPLGYIISFLLGIVGNYAAQWALDRRAEKITRRVMREGLAAEFMRNLRVLDNYDDVLCKRRSSDGLPVWPTGRLITAVIESCLEPSALTLLTATEQGKIPLIYSQLNRLRDDMTEAAAAARFQFPGQDPQVKRICTDLLPIGLNLIDSLCVVLTSQDEFSSKHAAYLSKAVLETELSTDRTPDRLWRTSDFARTVGSQPSINRVVYIWRDDDPTKIPEGTSIVLIHPPDTADNTIGFGSSSWLRRKLESRQHRRRLRRINKTI